MSSFQMELEKCVSSLFCEALRIYFRYLPPLLVFSVFPLLPYIAFHGYAVSIGLFESDSRETLFSIPLLWVATSLSWVIQVPSSASLTWLISQVCGKGNLAWRKVRFIMPRVSSGSLDWVWGWLLVCLPMPFMANSIYFLEDGQAGPFVSSMFLFGLYSGTILLFFPIQVLEEENMERSFKRCKELLEGGRIKVLFLNLIFGLLGIWLGVLANEAISPALTFFGSRPLFISVVFIPILFLLLWPLSLISSTLLYFEAKRKSERCKPTEPSSPSDAIRFISQDGTSNFENELFADRGKTGEYT